MIIFTGPAHAADKTITQLLAERGYRHTRDERSSTDYRHCVWFGDQLIGRFDAHEACDLLNQIDDAEERERLAWTQIKPFSSDTITYWINGIYKIVSYGPGSYLAYFIQEWARNWGDYVSPPPDKNDGWKTLESAKAACRAHSREYSPSAKTVRRADKIRAELLAEHKEAA